MDQRLISKLMKKLENLFLTGLSCHLRLFLLSSLCPACFQNCHCCVVACQCACERTLKHLAIFSIIFLYRAFLHYLPPPCSLLQPSSVESSSLLQRQVAASRQRLCHRAIFTGAGSLELSSPLSGAKRSHAAGRAGPRPSPCTHWRGRHRSALIIVRIHSDPPHLFLHRSSSKHLSCCGRFPGTECWWAYLQRDVHEGSVRKSKAIPTN
jgi:hypothetical protein